MLLWSLQKELSPASDFDFSLSNPVWTSELEDNQCLSF